MVRAKIRRWGNSLGLRIRQELAREIRIGDGSDVEIRITNGGIFVKPVDQTYELDEMLDGIRPSNLHGEADTGGPEGREEW